VKTQVTTKSKSRIQTRRGMESRNQIDDGGRNEKQSDG